MPSAMDTFDVYDGLTFITLIILAVAFFSVAMFILGLPGRVAIKRNHPHAEAVKLVGWVGFLAVIPWIHALIWAYHDAVVVDIRHMPEEQKEKTEKMIAELKGDKPTAVKGA